MGEVIQPHIVVALAAAVVAGLTDVWQFKVHNVVTLPLLISGLVYHGLVSGGPGLVQSVVGVVFGFGLLIVLYLGGGMGAGDVKLMAGLGAWLGMPLILYVFVASSIAAGVYALALVGLYHRHSAREAWTDLQIAWLRILAIGRHLGAEVRVEKRLQDEDRRKYVIPFGAMVTIGVVSAIVWTWIQHRA
jgi:prepilin peptidase CpaA